MARLTFHLIPHTHWDREWYLPRAGFLARLIPVMDEMLDQLEHDPAARFLLDGQTIILEDYLSVRPEQAERIRALVAAGSLEIGPWYVLADLEIPSVESLRRNLTEGLRQAGEFGGGLQVLYSPDAFGHPGTLPDLAAEFGLKYAVVRRGLGRTGDFYRWESANQHSVLVYQLSPGGYDLAIGLASETSDLASAWRPIRAELVERATSPHIAVFLGADHHAMVRQVSRLRRQLAGLEPGHEVRISGLGEFFQAVAQSPPAAPVIRGSLRRSRGVSWDLRGVHSSRSRLKRMHSTVELRLARIAEPLLKLAADEASLDRQALLAHAWRILLQGQFHDTLAGTTCDEAQREQGVRLGAVNVTSRALVGTALDTLIARRGMPAADQGRLILWNPVGRPRAGVVVADFTFFRSDVLVGPLSGRKPRIEAGAHPFAIAANQDLIPVQVLAHRITGERREDLRHYPDHDEVDRVWAGFESPELPGLGLLAAEPVRSARTASGPPLAVAPDTLRNSSVAVAIAPTGLLTLTDLASGRSLGNLAGWLDEPDQGDLYTYSREGRIDRGRFGPVAQHVLAQGPLVGAIETGWTMSFRSGKCPARSVTALYADSPLVRLRLDLHHWGADHRLRLRFPIGAGSVIAGSGHGIDREAQPGPLQSFIVEREVPTRPAHRFVAVSGAEGSFAVFAPGFFEYEWTSSGELLLTVLRSVGQLSKGELAERPGHAAWPIATPGGQELGAHRLELGMTFLPETGDLPAVLERCWEDLFLPIQAFYRRR
jgi:alpha-mannosidase